MRRYRTVVVAVLLHAILATSMPALAQSTFYTVYVNGVKVSGYPLVRDGVAYLPANTLAEAMGLSIKWDARLNIIKVNDTVIAARPLNEEGRLYLPVEAVAQSIGGTVEWDGRNKAIRVSASGSGGVAVVPSPNPLTVPVTAPTPVRTPTPWPSPTSPVVMTGPDVGTPSGQYPSPSAYPPPQNPVGLPPIRPPSAPPQMPPSMSLPPPTGGGAPVWAPAPSYATPTVYVPKSTQNNVFHVTVTNMETTSNIKDFYHPRPGYKFVIVYLSQQNVSNEVQIYTGRFSLLDQQNRSHDYIEGLSNFWLVILRPYGINFGYLVFEMPADAQPTRLALHALNQSPLTLNL